MGAWQPQQACVFVLVSEGAYGFGSSACARFQKCILPLVGLDDQLFLRATPKLLSCQQILVQYGPVAPVYIYLEHFIPLFSQEVKTEFEKNSLEKPQFHQH